MRKSLTAPRVAWSDQEYARVNSSFGEFIFPFSQVSWFSRGKSAPSYIIPLGKKERNALAVAGQRLRAWSLPEDSACRCLLGACLATKPTEDALALIFSYFRNFSSCAFTKTTLPRRAELLAPGVPSKGALSRQRSATRGHAEMRGWEKNEITYVQFVWGVRRNSVGS